MGDFTVNGKPYAFPENLTLGEMCDAERYFGVEFGNATASGIRLAAALIWIAISREDDSVTVDDIRALPPEVLAEAAKAVDASPPPVSADEKNEPSGATSEPIGDPRVETLEPTGSPV